MASELLSPFLRPSFPHEEEKNRNRIFCRLTRSETSFLSGCIYLFGFLSKSLLFGISSHNMLLKPLSVDA
ncbi:hypothetical protein AXX17_AT5G42720 [Arabidopsis thaliana]|uniref:Uncharacterized protein n=1 Tax=Arabidopsis thaliana TaxID=3702 RepID=A0A178UL97_ARATH|nr:hypothetical protein AXX17_AT5G42720 [Arabidopsis thaliana]